MISYDIHNYELKYVGNSRGLVIETYPSRRKVLLIRNEPYKFVPGDVINNNAIKYYNSMYSLGVRLIYKANTSKVSDNDTTSDTSNEDKKILEEVESKKEEVPSDTLLDSLNDDADNEIPSGVILSTEDDSAEDANSSLDNNSDISIDEEVISELLEYLDINYNDESIKSLASELKIKFRSNSSKTTIMNKIVNDPTGYSYVYNLVTK